MSKLDNVYCFLVLCIFSSSSFSHLDKVDKDTDSSVSSNYNLRCWQEGELLFEETGLEKKKKAFVSESGSLSFRRLNSQEPGVHLFRIGTSVCLYKKV